MKRSQAAVALCSVTAVLIIAQPIFAQKAFLEKFKEAYPGVDAKLTKCTTCHTIEGAKDKPGKKNLNAYGKDLQSAPEAKSAMGKETKGKYSADELKAVGEAIKAIGSKDSNGNGKTNDEDIKAGVNPGVK